MGLVQAGEDLGSKGCSFPKEFGSTPQSEFPTCTRHTQGCDTTRTYGLRPASAHTCTLVHTHPTGRFLDPDTPRACTASVRGLSCPGLLGHHTPAWSHRPHLPGGGRWPGPPGGARPAEGLKNEKGGVWATCTASAAGGSPVGTPSNDVRGVSTSAATTAGSFGQGALTAGWESLTRTRRIPRPHAKLATW